MGRAARLRSGALLSDSVVTMAPRESHFAHLRVARPSDNLEAVAEMYRLGLGFQRLGGFVDHAGFDGVMLGHPGAGYHLELTHHRGHLAGRAPTQDNLLVFYIADPDEWTTRCDAMMGAGFQAVPSYNPYWDRLGRTFEDLDGYRVVIQRAGWRLQGGQRAGFERVG